MYDKKCQSGANVRVYCLPQAREMYLNHKKQTQAHQLLLQKIGELIPNCLRIGLTNHYW